MSALLERARQPMAPRWADVVALLVAVGVLIGALELARTPFQTEPAVQVAGTAHYGRDRDTSVVLSESVRATQSVEFEELGNIGRIDVVLEAADDSSAEVELTISADDAGEDVVRSSEQVISDANPVSAHVFVFEPIVVEAGTTLYVNVSSTEDDEDRAPRLVGTECDCFRDGELLAPAGANPSDASMFVYALQTEQEKADTFLTRVDRLKPAWLSRPAMLGFAILAGLLGAAMTFLLTLSLLRGAAYWAGGGALAVVAALVVMWLRDFA